MFNLKLSLQLNIKYSRDKKHSMDDWLKEEIEAAKKRKERNERKLARREQDAEVIKRDKGKFWQALYNSLRTTIEEFNNSGASDEPITLDVREPSVWIRTPGYPSYQLVLTYREGLGDILVSLTRRETTMESGHAVQNELNFDVNDDGHIMLRNNGSLMDVSQTTQYLMRTILPIIHSSR